MKKTGSAMVALALGAAAAVAGPAPAPAAGEPPCFGRGLDGGEGTDLLVGDSGTDQGTNGEDVRSCES